MSYYMFVTDELYRGTLVPELYQNACVHALSQLPLTDISAVFPLHYMDNNTIIELDGGQSSVYSGIVPPLEYNRPVFALDGTYVGKAFDLVSTLDRFAGVSGRLTPCSSFWTRTQHGTCEGMFDPTPTSTVCEPSELGFLEPYWDSCFSNVTRQVACLASTGVLPKRSFTSYHLYLSQSLLASDILHPTRGAYAACESTQPVPGFMFPLVGGVLETGSVNDSKPVLTSVRNHSSMTAAVFEDDYGGVRELNCTRVTHGFSTLAGFNFFSDRFTTCRNWTSEFGSTASYDCIGNDRVQCTNLSVSTQVMCVVELGSPAPTRSPTSYPVPKVPSPDPSTVPRVVIVASVGGILLLVATLLYV